jgi:hypothetical protein
VATSTNFQAELTRSSVLRTNRRNLIKALTIGGGAVTAAKFPTVWTAPVIESVTLPAHAQTTGVTTLSGSTSDIDIEAVGSSSQLHFDHYARAGSFFRSIAERIAQPAHALEADFIELRAEGFAERDFARGDGWWKVQFLFREKLSDPAAQRSRDEPAPFPLDKLTSVAHAGLQYGLTCINEGLWKASVKLDASGDSNRATNVPVHDRCGSEEFGPINMQIRNADNPNNPAVATLVISVGSNELTRVPLNAGGGPLAVNCEGMACEERDNVIDVF